MAVKADPIAWGARPGADEVLDKRSRHSKHFRNPDGSFTAVIGQHLHYEPIPGVWDDVDLNFRASGTDFIADKHEVNSRVSGAWLESWDRKTSKGVRWLSPASFAVSGNTAKADGQGLTWRYTNRTSGLKIEATVSTKQGPKTYRFGYFMVGGARDWTVDAAGNLVSDGMSVPRAYVIGADGVKRDCTSWKLLAGPFVSFDFDDSALPPEAFPYVIDPTTIFTVAVGTDDGYAYAYQVAWPHTAPTIAASTTDTTVFSGRYLLSTNYYIVDGLVRWNTSSLPDTATVTAATLRCYITETQSVNGYTLAGEWYDAGATIGTEDYTPTITSNAFVGRLFSANTLNVDNDIVLSNLANVSLTGYTGLRIHCDNAGGTPTGINRIQFASFDNATVANRPRLIIDYTDVAAPAPNVTIVAPVATSTTLASPPTSTAERFVTIAAVVAGASSAAIAPIASATRNVDVASIVTTASATAIAPTISATANVSITAVVAQASAVAFAPSVSVGGNVMITAVVAIASATSYAPVINTQRQVTIDATLATATTIALSPNVVVQQNIAVQAMVATANASASPATITTTVGVTIAGIVASASANALMPTIAAQRQAVISVTIATATTTMFVPSLYITGVSLKALLIVQSMPDTISFAERFDKVALVSLDSTVEVTSLSHGPYLVGETREISVQLVPRYDVTLPGTITATWTATKNDLSVGSGNAIVVISVKSATVTALVPLASAGEYIVTYVINVGNEIIEKQEYIAVNAKK